MRVKPLLKVNPELRRLLDNAGWLFADRFLRLASGLVIGTLVARYLGPDQFGTYNFVLAFTSILGPLTTLGLDSIVIRDIVRHPQDKDEVLGTVFVLKFFGGLIALLFSVIAISLIRPGDVLMPWFVGITATGTVFQSFETIDLWFQSQVQSKYSVLAKNVSFAGVAGLKVILLLFHAPLLAFICMGLCEFIFNAISLSLTYRVRGNDIRKWKFLGTRARQLLGDSWPLVLSGFAISIQARIDQVLIGQMLGNSEVGQFSAAMRIIEVFGFVPMVVQSSLAPMIASAKSAGDNFFYEKLLKVYQVMFILWLVTAIPIFLLAQPLVVFCYGEEYREASSLLALFSIRLLFTNYGVAKSLFIANENLFSYSLTTAVIGAVANISFNLLLIPKYGASGAILAMIISFAITTFLIDIFYPPVRRNLSMMVRSVWPGGWKFNLS